MSEHWSFQFLPPGEPIQGKTYRADGWMYYDAPGKFAPHIWEKFLAVIGEGNFVTLAESRGEDWIRGQLLISPAGQANAEAFKNRNI